MRRPVTAALLAGAALAALGGCAVTDPIGTPITQAPRSAQPSASPAGPALVPAPPPVAPVVPAAPSSAGPLFPEETAVSCAGRPGVDRVVALLRSGGLLSSSMTVTAQLGPLCAGSWQYTVLAVPGREALQVVSKGAPGALVLVTAGTDVCSIPVRTQAPAGILTLTHCGA